MDVGRCLCGQGSVYEQEKMRKQLTVIIDDYFHDGVVAENIGVRVVSVNADHGLSDHHTIIRLSDKIDRESILHLIHSIVACRQRGVQRRNLLREVRDSIEAGAGDLLGFDVRPAGVWRLTGIAHLPSSRSH